MNILWILCTEMKTLLEDMRRMICIQYQIDFKTCLKKFTDSLSGSLSSEHALHFFCKVSLTSHENGKISEQEQVIYIQASHFPKI